MTRDYFSPSSHDDDLFNAEEAKRRAARREAAREARELLGAAEVKQAAMLKSRIDERARETNRRQVIAEYQAAGVEPPSVDGEGKPTASLSMLLRIGWKVENISGLPTLIRPHWLRASSPTPEPVFGAPRIEEDERENPEP